MGKVIFRRATYDYSSLKTTIFEMMAALDNNSIKQGTKVLIKPNLLSPATPEQAITTHPNVIRAAAEYALSKGASVMVADSSAVGTFEKVITTNGVKDALHGLDITLAPLTDSVRVETAGRIHLPATETGGLHEKRGSHCPMTETNGECTGAFRVIELSRQVLEADVVINLPKLKTHAQMALTLAVKNLFGCVVGLKKPEWHFRVGEDKESFAEVLATIYMQIKPSINLMDAILAMEGQGPGTRGTPRELGYLLGGTDALDVDMAACRLVGFDPQALLTTQAAQRLGAPATEPELQDFPGAIDGYVIPEAMDLVFGPRLTRGFFRRHIADRPNNIKDLCKYCNECVKICSAEAITNPGKKLHFDYDKCIRCYCCVEVCPHAAMEKQVTFLKRCLKVLLKRNK